MYKFGSPTAWDEPRVAVYYPTYHEEDVVTFGDRMMSRQVVPDKNILNDIAVILERPDASYLDDGAVEADDAPIGITVFREELYPHSRIEPGRRAEIKDEFGVVPLDSKSVLFQGVMFNGENGSLFHPVDRDFITHNPITDEDLIRQQRDIAEVFLARPHPTDNRTTPLGMLISLGTKPHR